MLASKAGAIDVVELIVKRGTDLDVENLEGENALFLAARHGHIEIVDVLLKSNAKPDADRKGHDGTPLHWAIDEGYVDIARLLLDYNAELETMNIVFQTPLLVATFEGQWDLAKLLVFKGANVNVKDNEIEVTPLHMASLHGRSDLVEILLDKGAEVNARTTDGQTALLDARERRLIKACADGDLPLCRQLISMGVDCNATMLEKSSPPLLVAISQRKNYNQQLVHYLIDNGANIDDRYLSTGTALHLAAWFGNDDVARKLLDSGANVDIVDSNGRTPLHQAVYQHKLSTVRLLLDSGADLSARDQIGRSPFLLSIDEDADVMEEIIARSPDLMVVDIYGRNATYYAADLIPDEKISWYFDGF
ncbi:ankyrin repeat-containing domain protein [Cadophora sp. MPI-SDFR-AT-0126]|nr:ankyrin repeat-containing domain protein [Leotiomycetes sp. MPI-SDFR-AT-0126]